MISNKIFCKFSFLKVKLLSLMPMTHIPVIGAGTRKPVLVPGASDMEFGIEFFRYQFLVTKRICSIFLPVYRTALLVPVFGADFWYVCHWHKLALLTVCHGHMTVGEKIITIISSYQDFIALGQVFSSLNFRQQFRKLRRRFVGATNLLHARVNACHMSRAQSDKKLSYC